MAVKPDKSRIMFTTEGSFESFLKDRCFIENRNMSNLVDTILKSHYEEEYKEYLMSIDTFVKCAVLLSEDDDFINNFFSSYNCDKIPFSTKLVIRNMLAHSSTDNKSSLFMAYKILEKEIADKED